MDRGKTRRKTKIDIFNMPTYVINMKERKDRWARFIQQPAVHLLKGLKHLTAINGKKLDARNDTRISIRTRLNVLRNYRRSHYEIATMGAVGASLSHIDAWKKFLKSRAKYCLILEDDAILTETALYDVNQLSSTLPTDWGIWLLGCYKPTCVFEHMNAKPWNRIYNFTAAHAYILSRGAAIELLKDAIPIESHIDHYMSDVAVVKDITIVQHPSVHVEFLNSLPSFNSPTRMLDSNTSQHKKNGCPMCKVPDDYSQLYISPDKGSKGGLRVKGLVYRPQSKKILTTKCGVTRKK